MAEYHFPIPGSAEEGKIVIFVRKHWAAFLGQMILICFLTLFPLLLFITLYLRDPHIYTGLFRNFWVLGLSTYYLIILTFSFTAWLTFYYDIYIITTDSIIDISQQGFFGRKISQLSLLRIQDTSSNIQGFIPTLFGYGNVLVETAGEQSQNFLLESILNPQEISSKIQELHRDLIEAEGRHHQVLEAEGALMPSKISAEGVSAQPKKEEIPPPKKELEVEKPPTPFIPEPSAKDEKPVEKESEGEVSHDDLDKGGQIDFK